MVDADVGGKALEVRIAIVKAIAHAVAIAVDLPLRCGVSRLGVLASNGVRGWGARTLLRHILGDLRLHVRAPNDEYNHQANNACLCQSLFHPPPSPCLSKCELTIG